MSEAVDKKQYLELLAKQYPTIRSASTEIINLSAILELPKGTEHFISDIHGEYESFLHVLRNGSGSIKRRIDELFKDTLDTRKRKNLATLIYYPEKKLPYILKDVQEPDEWYRETLFKLIKLCRVFSSKYTRSKVRKTLPEDFSYIIEELLHEQESIVNRQEYYSSIISTIIDTQRADAFIIAMARLIQRLTIARLHVIGDVYDRGPGAHIIMDRLVEHHSVDFQWGNHDIVWMGAAAGSKACIANVIRVSLRYANMETLENGYGISILPLMSLAVNVYGDDPCEQFRPKQALEGYTENEQLLMARMQKAISIIQLKLEGQIVQRRPQYQMNDRLLLDKIDYEEGTVGIGDKTYPLLDTHFPTIDPENPYELSNLEKAVMEKLRISFENSERLQEHVRFLFAKGSMYRVQNSNLLYHGCIPMTHNGKLCHFILDGVNHTPKKFMDRLERLARQGYFAKDDIDKKQYGKDTMWYLWCGAQSPLFGKNKMATFERYFIDDPETHKEEMNHYYDFRTEEDVAEAILSEFGVDPDTGHIINGHVPVKVKKGESPVKAGGKLIVIDGGFAKAYQEKTGIAGYTLIYNSYGLVLAAHQPFESTQKAIEEEQDIHSETKILEENKERIRVCDTDNGRKTQKRIDDLKELLQAYRSGLINEA
ncbi:fructose-1,6-bisphosphatase [Aliifodinibius salicampi]|uniref:Fructose-1,6-bisphosphatase n=1 Tax=Fodinibius salicampi TaxID=1920655 RepID=A0ABT3Q1C3_9BACT|nr:fructose-1,6-bisphosphatase [Fodinibius salicampi]MCW9713895.1 fructose-1,6-bisphosphatase [Fodinibius salicampi]